MPAPEGQVTDLNPIINDPYGEPTRHWAFGEGEPRIVEGRREAGYLPRARKGEQLRITDDMAPMGLVNRVRSRVKEWREAGYPGATRVTRDLFDHWFDPEREAGQRPFFAQREAMETIAFLTEASADRKQGINVPRHEEYERLAVKVATGAGKTLIMAMCIAWSGLNKLQCRQDARFADAFLVVCPNLTVKERLSGSDGVGPSDPRSAYRSFDLIPPSYSAAFGAVRVAVLNWHALAAREDPARSVMKRGDESDAAFCRRVLRDLGEKPRIVVLNDEAHHAWRPPKGLHLTGEEEKELEEATVWIRGLERIHRSREILRTIDFSATPMYPGAMREKAWQPFEWIVSDFALVDAIESGLVKVPRIPTDDNAGRAVPKYRNLWEHVKRVLPKRGDDPEDEGHPFTAYLTEVDGPLKQLAGEWRATLERWTRGGRHVPPAMVIVCADTKMAEVLETYIAARGEAGPWLSNRDGENYTVRIDSKLLAKAEIREERESAHDAAERLREVVATVGKPGEPGAEVRCLISVAMLSEGWDARNVTQILGLRAFQSQLLCEQVVGRGLRRSDYTDLSRPEYVDVYGVPFQLLPFAKATATTAISPPETTHVRSLKERSALRLEFPRVAQIVHDVGDELRVDMDAIAPIFVSASQDPTETFVEFEAGTPGAGLGGVRQTREEAYKRFRMQHLVFRIAADIVRPTDRPWLFPQAMQIVQRVIDEKVRYEAGVDRRELGNLRYAQLLAERTRDALRPGVGRTGALVPVLDEYMPIGSTDGVSFATTKSCEPTRKSHLSHSVLDSKLEGRITRQLERDEHVAAYVKNERLHFEIPYRFQGKTHRYRPDFLVRLVTGEVMVIEGKGIADEKDRAKETAAKRWIAAVNEWGKLGRWHGVAVCGNEREAKAAIAAAAVPSVPA